VLRQTSLQLTQGIFRQSSPPPQKKLDNKNSMEEIIPDETLKKEMA
jgi:hypothetical protein